MLADVGVRVSDAWQVAFAAHEARQGLAVGARGKADAAFAHWINCEISQAALPSLPPNVVDMHKQVIPGPLILQVNAMDNIAETLDAQKSFKGGNRTLRLMLSDGSQVVHAIELHPVPELVSSLQYGFKVAIRDVPVHRGLLLLSPGRVHVLGGSSPMPPAQPTPALPPAQIPAPPQAQQHAPPRPSAGAAPDFYDDMDMDLLDEGDAEAEAVLREREESEAARPPQHAPPRQAPRPAQPAPGQPFQAPPRPVFQKKAPMQARAAADDEFDAELLIDAEQRALAARTLAARPPQLPAVAPPRRDQRFTTPDDSDDDDVFKTPALPLVKSSTVERSSHQVAAPPSTSHPLRPTATAPMQRADAPISASVSAATPVVAVSRFFGMPQTISPPQLPPQLPPQASHAPAATVPHVAHVTPPAAPVLHQRKPLSLSLKGPTSASMPVVAPVSQVAPGQPVQSLGPPSRSASAALPGVCETIDVSSGSSSDDDDDDMLQSIRKVGTPLITVCPIKPFSFLEELQARTPTPSEIGMKFRCSAFALGLDWFSTNKEGYEAGATLEGCGEAAGRTVQAAIQPDYVQSIINVPPLEFKAMLKRSAEDIDRVKASSTAFQNLLLSVSMFQCTVCQPLPVQQPILLPPYMSRVATVCFAVVIAVAFVGIMAQQYPGCKTDAQCQSTGDKGGYCKPNGYCHCSFPAFNNTFWGYCVQEMCFSDADCQSGGDTGGSCNMNTHACNCNAPYANAPSPAFCLFPSCTSDADCRASGDTGAYCQSNGACHCDVLANYAQYPTNAYCQIPPWV